MVQKFRHGSNYLIPEAHTHNTSEKMTRISRNVLTALVENSPWNVEETSTGDPFPKRPCLSVQRIACCFSACSRSHSLCPLKLGGDPKTPASLSGFPTSNHLIYNFYERNPFSTALIAKDFEVLAWSGHFLLSTAGGS